MTAVQTGQYRKSGNHVNNICNQVAWYTNGTPAIYALLTLLIVLATIVSTPQYNSLETVPQRCFHGVLTQQLPVPLIA